MHLVPSDVTASASGTDLRQVAESAGRPANPRTSTRSLQRVSDAPEHQRENKESDRNRDHGERDAEAAAES